MLLVGRHVNRIDKKGRVSVPKPLRESILKSAGDDGFQGLFVFPSFKDEALRAAGEGWMRSMADRIDDMDEFSEDQDDMAIAVLESAHQLPFDPEGRVVLPGELISHAGIKGEVLFASRGGSMYLWNPAKYELVRKAAFERARARKATLPKKPAMDGGGS